MKSQVLTIAIKEFSDRFRSGWVVGCIAVWFAAICLTSFFGLIQIGKTGFQGYERTVLSVLNLSQYLVPLLALLIGYDLIVAEREERTLALLVASGVSRWRALAGKALGAGMTLTFSLALAFIVAGVVIGNRARDTSYGSFLTLALTGLALGWVFLSLGLAISALAKSRVQSLVLVLFLWGTAVFAFDLLALGALVSFVAPAAQKEIEVVCDPIHINAVAADVHAAFDTLPDAKQRAIGEHPVARFSWLYVNPVDAFRAVNLSTQLSTPASFGLFAMTTAGWIAAGLLISYRGLRKLDL